MGVRKQLRKTLGAGKITQREYDKLKKASTYRNCQKMMDQMMLRSGDYPILEAIYAFVVENWDEILKALVLLASLVLDSEDG